MALDLVAIDDLVLADVGVTFAMVTKDSRRLGFGVRRRDGVSGSVFFGSAAEPATWEVAIKTPDLAARSAVLAALAGDLSEERRLLAKRDDLGNDLVVTFAALVEVEEYGELDLKVTLESSDSVWRALSATEATKDFSSTLDHALLVPVGGNAPTAPVLRLTPLAQRTAFTSAVGWRRRQRWTVTNGGDEPWFRFPVRITLGNTAALVSGGKALASGNDLRVWLDGLEQPRTLVGWNTATTHAWVIVPALAPGEALTYDVVYGNPGAGAAPELAYPDLPAFRLDTSTNAAWNYLNGAVTANAGKGLWHLSSSDEGAIADFGVPGAWAPARTWRNPASTDETGQNRYRGVATGGPTDPYLPVATLDAFRMQSGGGAGFLGTLTPNGYDGVTFAHPLGVTGITLGLRMEAAYDDNVRAVVAVRNSAAEGWVPRWTQDAWNVATAVTPTFSGTPGPVKQVAVATWPYFDISLENVLNIVDDNPAYGLVYGSETNWSVSLVTAGLGIAQTTAEEEIYELAAELRLGGGSELTPPYRTLLVGNARSEAGPGTPRAACRLDQALVIDCAARTHEVWNAAVTARAEAVSAHAVSAYDGRDDRGVAREFRSSDWLPLLPPRTVVPNGTFDADAGSWGLEAATTGMTVEVGWDFALGGDAAGSLYASVNANSAGVGATAQVVGGRRYVVNNRAAVQVAAWVRTNNANLRPRLQILFYNEDETLVATETQPEWASAPAVGVGYRRAYAARVPAGATRYRIGLLARAAAAGATGTCWFDDVTANDTDLIVRDPAVGQIRVAALVRPAWA